MKVKKTLKAAKVLHLMRNKMRVMVIALIHLPILTHPIRMMKKMKMKNLSLNLVHQIMINRMVTKISLSLNQIHQPMKESRTKMEKTRKKLTVQNQMTAQMNSLSLQMKRRIVKLLILALQSNHQFQRKV